MVNLFKKKKKKLPRNSSASAAALAAEVTQLNDQLATTNKKKTWSPMRRSRTTPATEKSRSWSVPPTNSRSMSRNKSSARPHRPSLLDSLNIMALDNIEVVTAESRDALVKQREAIRKQLFNAGGDEGSQEDSHIMHRATTERWRNTSMFPAANDTSHEILPNGKIVPVLSRTLSAEEASMPISAVSSESWDDASRSVEIKTMTEPAADSSQLRISPEKRPTPADSAAFTPSEKQAAAIRKVTPPSSDSRLPMDERRELQEKQQKLDDERDSVSRNLSPQLDAADAMIVDLDDLDETIGGGESTQASTYRSFATTQTIDPTMMAAQSAMKVAMQCGTDVVGQTLGRAAALCVPKRAAGDSNNSVTPSTVGRHRPVYFDEGTTLKFIRRITNSGFVLLFLQPLTEGSLDSEDWNGRTVTMILSKGQVIPSSDLIGPKLEWSTVRGGQAMDVATTSVDLLDIVSIEMDEDEDDEESCLFNITTNAGDVHIFEATSVEERDRIVNGLKTVIARWSYHLVTGDTTATSELYNLSVVNRRRSTQEELPSLPNPSLAMNRVAHQLLEA